MDDRGRKKGIYNINGEFFPVFLEFRTLSRHMVSDDAGIMEEPPGF